MWSASRIFRSRPKTSAHRCRSSVKPPTPAANPCCWRATSTWTTPRRCSAGWAANSGRCRTPRSLRSPRTVLDTHRLHTGPRPAAVGENRRTHGGLHHRRFGPLPAVGVARLVDSGAGAPYTILHDRSSAPILPLRGTKPLPEAGVWGWVRIANDAEGGENDRRFSHAV